MDEEADADYGKVEGEEQSCKSQESHRMGMGDGRMVDRRSVRIPCIYVWEWVRGRGRE